MTKINTLVPALVTMTALSACSPGDGGGGVTFDDTLGIRASSDLPANLTVILADQATSEVTTTTGQYNRDDDTFEVAGLSGSLNTANDSIALDGGGEALVSLDGVYSGAVLIQQASGTEFGVYGIPSTSLPSGTAQMTGEASVVIVDGEAVYDLMGTSTVDVDFAANRLKTSLTNLDGTRTDAAAVTDVTDVAQLDLTFVSITDGTFSGGFVDLFSDTLSNFESEQEVLNHEGAFFGPDGAEVGAVFTIDDTQVGSLLIQGVYTADKP